MNNVVSKVLLIIVILLIGLFAYKTIRNPNTASAKISLEAANAKPVLQLNDVQKVEKIDTAKIEKIIQNYLLNNPEIIIQAMEILQQRKKEEMEQKTRQYIKEHQSEVVNITDSPVLGNNNADVIITAFYDYNCSYCKKGDKFINQLIKLDNGVKVILKPFPILGDSSYYVASVALAVHRIAPLKFKVIHDGLIAMQDITSDAVEKLLRENELDPSLIIAEAGTETVKNILEKNTNLARGIKLQGVPAYIINGKLMPGMMNLEQLQQVIGDLKVTNAKN